MRLPNLVDSELSQAGLPSQAQLVQALGGCGDVPSTVAASAIDLAERLAAAQLCCQSTVDTSVLGHLLGQLGTLWQQLARPAKPALAASSTAQPGGPSRAFLALPPTMQLLARYGLEALETPDHMPILGDQVPWPTRTQLSQWREQGLVRQVQHDRHGDRCLRFTTHGAKFLRDLGITIEVTPDANERALDEGGIHPTESAMVLLREYARDAEHWAHSMPVLGANCPYPDADTLRCWAYERRLVLVDDEDRFDTRLRFTRQGAEWAATFNVNVPLSEPDNVDVDEAPMLPEAFLAYGDAARTTPCQAPELTTEELKHPGENVLANWINGDFVEVFHDYCAGGPPQLHFQARGRMFLRRHGITLH